MSLVRIRDRVPRVGKGSSALLEQLERLFSDPNNKLIQRVVLDVQTTHIELEKLVPEEQASETQTLSLYATVRQKHMEEYVVEGSMTPHQHLFEASLVLLREGLVVSHLLLHKSSRAYSWLALPRRVSNYLGVQIVLSEGVPEDVLLLCGSKDRRMETEDIEMSVKVSIP